MSTITWQWVVKDFVADASKRRVDSAPFFDDGHKVYLAAVKKETDTGDKLALYVHLPDSVKLGGNIGIGLAKTITLVHRKDHKLNISYSDEKSEPPFHSSSSTSWGWKFIGIDEVSKPDSGFVSEDGAILVEVQLFPITAVKWELPDFANLTGRQQSPEFAIGETKWRISIDPQGNQKGATTHVSAYLDNLAVKSWKGLSVQAKISLSCLEENKRRKHEFDLPSAFSATSGNSGNDHWIPLSAMVAPSPILPDGTLHVVANVVVESIRWLIDSATLLNLQRMESATFSLGGATWKAVAGSTIGETTGNKVSIALTSCDAGACNGEFTIRPEFQISLSKGNVALATNADANDRPMESGIVFWGACFLPTLDAVADPTNLEATFALSTKRTTVSWTINDFRHFLGIATSPSALKSGKIIAGGSEVELTVYPQGNGRGRYSHVSCFVSVTPTASRSDVLPKMKFSFTAHRSREKTHCVLTEEVVVDEQPVGVARFLRLNDVEDFLGEDGELRVDVSWGDASSTQPPMPPCHEEADSGIDMLQHVLAAEKKWRDVRRARGVSSPLGELDKAAQMFAPELSSPDAWEIPTHISAAVEACSDAWAAYTLKQNEVRELAAGRGDTRDVCAQRDEARRAFCKTVDDMNAIDDMSTFHALREKEIPTVPDLELRFPMKAIAEIWEIAIVKGLNALERWAQQKQEWGENLKEIGKATDNAAREMRDALGCLFDADSTALFDGKKSQSSYINFLNQLYEEERLQAECAPSFPTEMVVEAYYAMKEKATMTKKRTEDLWEDKERAMARKGEVEKWLAEVPNGETLTKLEREGKQLMAKRRRLQADQFEAELEEDGPSRAAKEESVKVEMRVVADALRKVDKTRLEELGDLWKIQQDHFPELPLLPEPSVGEMAPFLSEHRFLDMYLDLKGLHAGHHQIWQANFLGQPCVLKQFVSHVEMLREAKVQHRLRHRAVVPVEAVFRITGSSYIQLPLYECDLAAWLRANTVDVGTLRNMASCILQVVAHIHQCNLVHGDLKPRNFLVDADSQLVLCDFGSSRTTNDATGTLPTVTRMCGGTQGYMAPELAQDGLKPSKATDMYSVGCIILDDLIPLCSGAFWDLKDLRRLATTCRSQDASKRPTAMAALAEMTHRPLSDFPAYWKTKGGDLSRLYDNTNYMEGQALRLLRDSTTHTGTGECSAKRLKEAVIVKVERNENPVLFRNYLRKKAEIAEYHRKSHNAMSPIDLPLGEDKEWLIDPSVNECYLMHGTLAANVPKILEDGLNERVANFGGLYGVGSYFASESCKAMQYCRKPLLLHDPVEPGQVYCILMCRVLVGDAYNTDKIFQPAPRFNDYLREPPAREDKKRWDSIIAAPGEKKNSDGSQAHNQTHYETIIFDRTQIYPEFVIHFKVPLK